MYSETITLFNRYHSRQGDIWFPHVLRKVNLIVDKASIMAKYGAETTDKASLHVKYGILNGSIVVGVLPYLSSKEWYKLTNDELKDYITFNSDSNYFDFFILGEYENTEPITDKNFFADMEDETECYAITSVSSPYKVIPHFEIMAK